MGGIARSFNMSNKKGANKWRGCDVVIFLEYYRKYECLWNVKSAEYRNKTERDRAYELLKKDMSITGLTVNDVKLKIKNIRTTYSVELNKINKSTTSGTGSDDVYKPKLFWFKQADLFLRGVTETRKSTSNMEDNNPQRNDEGRKDSILDVTPNSAISSSKKHRSNVAAVDRALTQLSDISKANETDEFDLFGKTLALQLKKMPLDIAIRLQEKMQSLVNQERLKLLHEHTTTYTPVCLNTSAPSTQTSHNSYCSHSLLNRQQSKSPYHRYSYSPDGESNQSPFSPNARPYDYREPTPSFSLNDCSPDHQESKPFDVIELTFQENYQFIVPQKTQYTNPEDSNRNQFCKIIIPDHWISETELQHAADSTDSKKHVHISNNVTFKQ